MSEENVEIVRRITEEFTETQRVSELVSPDLVWHAASWSAWAGPPEYHGRDEFIEFFAEWAKPYDEWTQDVERIIDVDDRRVISITRQRARLRNSDVWVQLRMAYLYTVENGRVVRGEIYAPPEEALEAAGLSE